MNLDLPFEIWSRVFCQLPDGSLIQLMRVSRAWRNIANATPQLWTHFDIRHPRQFADHAGLLRRLKLSGELPLDVIVKVPLGVTDWELRATLALLQGHVRRFRVLNIDVPTADIADIILLSIAITGEISNGNSAPLLEDLRIAIDESESMPTNEEHTYFEHAFYSSPRLQKLTFSSLRIPPPSTKLLSTVTSLTITSGPDDQLPYVEAMLDAIAAIPHLEYLKYSGYDVFSYQSTHSLDYPRVVVLPHLKVADVTAPGCGLDILQCLEAPQLTFVRLDGWREADYAEEWTDSDLTDVSAWIKRLSQRAQCIRRLDLHHLEFLPADTFTWLFNQTYYTHLEELRIDGSTITDTSFTQSSSHGPHLRRLELIGCENITGNALIAYIEARHLSVEDHFQLSVSGCPGVDDEHLAQIRCLATVEDVEN